MGRKKLDVSALSYEQLEERYEKLLHRFASNYTIPGMDRTDLMQELRMTLLNAQQKFDASRGVQFVTYLYNALQNTVRWRYRDSDKDETTNVIPNEIYEDDTSFVETVGHTSPLAQAVALAIVNEEDYRDMFSEEQVDSAFAELRDVLGKENE